MMPERNCSAVSPRLGWPLLGVGYQPRGKDRRSTPPSTYAPSVPDFENPVEGDLCSGVDPRSSPQMQHGAEPRWGRGPRLTADMRPVKRPLHHMMDSDE